jgi:heme-degrading monooxygenase HmoA
MHARSGEFELSSDGLDEAINSFRDEFLPRYQQQSGYKGFTLLANRETGQLMGISFWESESDIQGSDDLGQQTREEMHRRGGGQGAIQRTDWEVVVDDMA